MHTMHMIQDFKRRFWVCVFLTVPLFAYHNIYILFALSSVVFFFGGWPFLKGCLSEIRARKLGMMTLIAVAISTAYIYSTLVVLGLSGMLFFGELATLVDIMLLGHWIEMKSVMGASMALEKLAQLMPAHAHKIISENKTQDVAISSLIIDDKVLVKPGEKIPADGIVIAGDSSVNESMLTGESKPIPKQIQENVLGGSINGEGSISILVKKIGQDSFLSQVINLVKQA